eukprot:5709898-Pleurochrysis_carterae.AAC.1
MEFLKAAIPGAYVFDIVEYTHDWKLFFKDCIYSDLAGITDAREYIIKQRSDGGATHTLSMLHRLACASSECYLFHAASCFLLAFTC